MSSPRHATRLAQLHHALAAYESQHSPLPGLQNATARNVLALQIIDSERRVRHPSLLLRRQMSPKRDDPTSDLFDPLRAAVLHLQQGDIDNAAWMVFLFVHFGKHWKSGYRLAAAVYSRGQGDRWDWDSISLNLPAFRKWLTGRAAAWATDGVQRAFGNHRKFESISHIPDVFESYVHWVGPSRSHQFIFDESMRHTDGTPEAAFDLLYRSLSRVHRFGRLAKFDFLTMLGKLQIAPVAPGSLYLHDNATGPLEGTRVLLGAAAAGLNSRQLDAKMVELGKALAAGPQALEDAICNWQKDTTRYIRYTL